MDYAQVLDQITALAKEVGSFQKANMFRSDLSVDLKSSDIDLVTEIDKQSDGRIRAYLTEHFPSHAILTEESGDSGVPSDYQWVVDPLDGTTNYAQGLPIYAVSIALKHRGETVLGVVYAPALGDLFTAVKGRGAYRNGRKMQVSPKTSLISSVLVTGFPYDVATHPVNNVGYFTHMLPITRAVRRFGSAACDLALVADGRFDGYWEMALNPWDVSAAALMVEESGGMVLPFRTDRNISIVAGNETMCSLLLNELRKAEKGGSSL